MAVSAEILELASKLASGDLTSEGTLGEFVNNGELIFNDKNVAGKKTVMIDYVRPDGLTGRIFASREVGTQIRERKLTVGQLLGLRVVKGTTEEGKPTLRLVSWESSTTSIKTTGIAADKSPVKANKTVANLADLGGI